MASNGDHGWRGGGRFRIARVDGWTMLRFAKLSTRRTAFTEAIGAFFRKERIAGRPSFDPFEVLIRIETPTPRRRLDVDNVAKSCLDALTGRLWKDDSQVMRLVCEKQEAEAERIVVCARPIGGSPLSLETARLIAAADGLT